MTIPPKGYATNSGLPPLTSDSFSERFLQHRHALTRAHTVGKTPLRIMKFGGTSVGDASCIEKVVEIIRASAGESDPVVVVSAMSGVTNKLIDAATQAIAGNRSEVTTIFDGLREQHERVIRRLIHSATERERISGKI